MTLKASDLSYEAKQQLLNQIRSQVGSTEYDNLLDAFGEDGLIDFALMQVNNVSENHLTKKRKEEQKRSETIKLAEGSLIVIACLISLNSLFGDVSIPWKNESWGQVSLVLGWVVGGAPALLFAFWWLLDLFFKFKYDIDDASAGMFNDIVKSMKNAVITPFRKKGSIGKFYEIMIVIFGVSLLLAFSDI